MLFLQMQSLGGLTPQKMEFSIKEIADLVIFTELKNIHENPQIKEHRCKFKINKTTYSKSESRTTYDVSKNKPSVYP